MNLLEETMNILPLYGPFKSELKHQKRYLHSKTVATFLERLGNILESYLEELPKGMNFYRTQLGHNDDNPNSQKIMPHSIKRMIPWKDKAKEGRINPKGIPCFYMSSDLDTAIKEIRPKHNEYVSVAKIKTIDAVKVINLIDPEADYYAQPINCIEDGRKFIRKYLNKDFAEPISSTDDLADYVPTQVIAELIKSKNYEGIKYKSSVGKGENLALFNFETIEEMIVEISLYKIHNIKYLKVM